jgi:hypothetical protein
LKEGSTWQGCECSQYAASEKAPSICENLLADYARPGSCREQVEALSRAEKWYSA